MLTVRDRPGATQDRTVCVYVYIVGVPNVTIYVNGELWEVMRKEPGGWSAVCQRAIWAEAKRRQREKDKRASELARQFDNQQEAK